MSFARAVATSLVFALAAGSAGPAEAQFRSMGWGDSTPGHQDANFDCANPPPEATLVVSFSVPASEILGITAKIDMCTLPRDLPEWWRFDVPGGCREGVLEVSTDFSSGPNSYPVAWTRSVSTSLEVLPGYAWSASMNRFIVSVSTANGQPFSLQPGQEYYAFRLRFLTPAGSCPGCELPACFMLNGLTVETTSGPIEAGGNFYEMYGRWKYEVSGGCPFVVPAAYSSWGQVKASYR